MSTSTRRAKKNAYIIVKNEMEAKQKWNEKKKPKLNKMYMLSLKQWRKEFRKLILVEKIKKQNKNKVESRTRREWVKREQKC